MNHARSFAVIALLASAGCDSAPIAVVGLAPTTLNEGLLAHYTFDEGSGTTAFDQSGNRHDGVIFGTGWYWIPDGKFGGALHLGGASDAGLNDAGLNDAGPDDADADDLVAYYDAGTIDADPADSSVSDAGANDADPADAGLSDAGVNDASTTNPWVPGDYVSIANFPNAPSDFTLSAWVRSSVGPFIGYQTIASTEIPNQSGWELNLENPTDGGGLGSQFAFFDPTYAKYERAESFGVQPNQWTHLAAVVDSVAMTLTLYIADELVGSTPISPSHFPRVGHSLHGLVVASRSI